MNYYHDDTLTFCTAVSAQTQGDKAGENMTSGWGVSAQVVSPEEKQIPLQLFANPNSCTSTF